MILFLDIDGVLNDHTEQENRYCGTKPACVSRFNRILDAFPELRIVVSSAWRYMILRGDMTLRGFEMLLLTHGVKCHERIVGYTGPDGAIENEPNHQDREAWIEAGLRWRRDQIQTWVQVNDVASFVVLDDLLLDMPELFRTDGTVGLSDADVEEVCRRLREGA